MSNSVASIIDANAYGQITFSAPVYFIREDGGTAVIPVNRINGDAEQVARGRRALSIDVRGPRELKTLKAGALLAVAQGSAEQPRMIVTENLIISQAGILASPYEGCGARA